MQKIIFSFSIIAVFNIFLIYAPPLSLAKEKTSLKPAPVLTIKERNWYKKNKNRISMSLYSEFAPYEFLDANNRPAGISEDVIKLIEKKLNISFKRKVYKRWKNILSDIKNGNLTAIQNIQNIASRRKYLSFTDPYLSIPNAVIVRSDWKGRAGIKELSGKKAAIVEGYATINYMKNNHPDVLIIKAHNDATGLKMLAFNQVDAVIMNLEQATYNINKFGITNLKVGETIDFQWKLCIGVSKNFPILHSIIKKGLRLVTKEEIESLHIKWIHIEQPPFYKMPNFQLIAGGTFTLFIFILSFIAIWNRILAKQVSKKTTELQESHNTLEKKVKERTAELTTALENIKELKGLIPICSSCKKIRNGKGYWTQVDEYLIHHTDALVSHGLCNDCAKKLYGDQKWFKDK